MTLIVTGASGFVGGPLSDALEAVGHKCVRVTREQNGSAKGDAWKSRADVLSGDGRFHVDAVVHLEVKQHIQRPSTSDIEDFERVNVRGTIEWLDWATRNGVSRFVLFSSIKAAASSRSCQKETDSPDPRTPYGASKLRAEVAVTNWARKDPSRSALILRPAVIYGPGNRANMLSLVKAILARRYFIVGKNDNVKSLISLPNLIAAVVHLMSLPFNGVHLFYLTDRESYSVAEIAQMINELVGNGRRLPHLPLPAAKAVACLGDLIALVARRDFPLTSQRLEALTETTHFCCAKLQATGFIHPQNTLEGLREMIRWYLQQELPASAGLLSGGNNSGQSIPQEADSR